MSSTLRAASKDTLQVKDKTWHYYSLPLAAKELGDLSRLPKSLKVLLENLLRWQDGDSVTAEDIHALAGWLQHAHADREIAYRPARVLMQDFTRRRRSGGDARSGKTPGRRHRQSEPAFSCRPGH